MEQAVKRNPVPKLKLANIEKTEDGTLYGCVECPVKYIEKEKLEVHLCSHFTDYRFLCGICGSGLKRKEHLDRHTLGHLQVRPHVCPECNKGFKRKEHLTIHMSIHTGDKTQFCPLCQRSFYRKDHLQKHLQTHNKMFMEHNIFPVSDQELDIKQEFVDVKMEMEDDMGCEVMLQEVEDENESSHQNITPKDPLRPFECHICHKTYKRRDHLKMHSVSHMAKDKICSECGKGFVKEEQLLAHIRLHGATLADHQLESRPGPHVQAFIANEEIDIMPVDELNLLMPRKPSPESRPHECSVCHRRFKRRQHLKVHANVHVKQNTVWCSLCHEGFHNNSQFESHQCLGGVNDEEMEDQTGRGDAKKENHPAQRELPTPVSQPFKDNSLEEEQHIPTPQRVYVCKYCSKPFKRKDHYKIHLHIHTGIKSFFCPDCGKGFYRKDHLQKHTLVHLKPKPRVRRSPPALLPITTLHKEVRPEITITAPSNTKLRVPLQMKVPYQMVMSMDNGEQRAVTIEPQVHAIA